MSKVYDAKQAVLKAHPVDRDAGVDLFYTIIDMDECDFEYEFDESAEKYIYGDELPV